MKVYFLYLYLLRITSFITTAKSIRMTAREIIYDIREKFKFSTDDIDITDEYLFHLINVKRALLVKQRYAKASRNIPEEMKQIICVPLQKVDNIEGLCDEYHNVMQSTVTIPHTIEIGGRSSLHSVRTMQITGHQINIIPMERMPNIGYNKYLKNQIYVALDANKKLYLKTSMSPTYLDAIKVVGVFQDPEEAFMLSCNEEDAICDFYDTEYPIESYIVRDMVNMISQELAPSQSIPEDNLNNADESNR